MSLSSMLVILFFFDMQKNKFNVIQISDKLLYLKYFFLLFSKEIKDRSFRYQNLDFCQSNAAHFTKTKIRILKLGMVKFYRKLNDEISAHVLNCIFKLCFSIF